MKENFKTGKKPEKAYDIRHEKPTEQEEGETSLQSGQERVQYLYDSGFLEESRMYEKICRFAEKIAERGGRAYIAGGSVRDEIIGTPSKDYDIEVHGIETDDITATAETFGETKEIGKDFCVLQMQIDGFKIEIAPPRKERSTGKKHKDFSVEADPHMGLREACKRRDFTINAMLKDILTGELHDFFNGQNHLQERRLCMTDPNRFTEDSLRALRGVRFAGKLGLFVEDETAAAIRKLRDDMEHLPKERFAKEWSKIFLESEKPSLGLNAAMELGIFHTMHPEIVKLPDTQQEPEWHPEGDVWIHTLMVVDEAAKIAERERLEKEDALVVLLAAFCHDFGKPITTEESDGRIRAHGHEAAGEEPADKFLREIGIEGKIRDKIKRLVVNHLAPTLLYTQEMRGGKVTDGAIKKLANRIHPATIRQLVSLARADALGRGPFVDPDCPERSCMPTDFPAGKWLTNRCAKLGVEKEKPKPILFGRDLVAFGFKPGPAFGKIIRHAETLHIKGLTREEILTRIDTAIHTLKQQHDDTPPLENVLETLRSE